MGGNMKQTISIVAAILALGGHALSNENDLTVNADAMQQVQDQQLIHFSGDVEVINGTMVLNSQEGRAYYGDGGPSDLVEYIASGGRVALTTPEQQVEADEARYDFPAASLTFSGSVILLTGETRIESDEMVILIDEGRTHFLGTSSPNRVSVTSTASTLQ